MTSSGLDNSCLILWWKSIGGQVNIINIYQNSYYLPGTVLSTGHRHDLHTALPSRSSQTGGRDRHNYSSIPKCSAVQESWVPIWPQLLSSCLNLVIMRPYEPQFYHLRNVVDGPHAELMQGLNKKMCLKILKQWYITAVQLLSCVQLSLTPRTVVCQTSLSFIINTS